LQVAEELHLYESAPRPVDRRVRAESSPYDFDDMSDQNPNNDKNDSPTPAEALRENAAGPASVESDGVKVRQLGLREQIEADRYLAGREAVRRPRRGLRFGKIVPPGTA